MFPYYQKSLSPCFGDNTADVKTNEHFLFLIPFPHKRLCDYFVPEPYPISAFQIPLTWKYGNIYSTEEQVVSFTKVIQLQYSYEYGNWNSFKNRHKWTSGEMFLRRFFAAFRTLSIKNTHRWLLPKCSFAEYSQSIQEKPM